MIDIDKLIAEARKARNQVDLKTYQNIKVEFDKFKHAQILERKLTEEIQLRIMASYAKKLEDAILQFSEAGREDLASEYTSELEVVQKLLPEPVTAEELDFHLYNWADELNYYGKVLEDRMEIAIPKKEMGNAIKFLKSKFPTADGKMISEIVKKYIV